MLALGCSNFFGSFFKIHVICCALSVTLAVDGAGAKSQVSSSSSSLLSPFPLDHKVLQLPHVQLWRSFTPKCFRLLLLKQHFLPPQARFGP